MHLAARCSRVTGVDSSRPALEVADQNAALNSREIEWIEANAFDLLKDYAASGQRYDSIVLDPPAFAKTKRDLDAAMRGYKELNLRALKMLRPGGASDHVFLLLSREFAGFHPNAGECGPGCAAHGAHRSRFADRPKITRFC